MVDGKHETEFFHLFQKSGNITNVRMVSLQNFIDLVWFDWQTLFSGYFSCTFKISIKLNFLCCTICLYITHCFAFVSPRNELSSNVLIQLIMAIKLTRKHVLLECVIKMIMNFPIKSKFEPFSGPSHAHLVFSSWIDLN